MRFETEIKVRFRDLDALQHVNNAVFFSFMEQARTEYYARLSGILDLGEMDFILASAKCDFRSPVGLGETVVVRAWPTRIGESSFTLRYELRVREDGRVVAEGESVQVAYDYRAGRSKPLPTGVRSVLEAELASADSARGPSD